MQSSLGKFLINKFWRTKPLISIEAMIGILLMMLLSLPYIVVVGTITEIDAVNMILSDLANTRVLILIGSSLLLSSLVAIVSSCIGLIVLFFIVVSNSKTLVRLLLVGSGITFCLSPVVILSAWQAIPWVINLEPLWNVIIVLSWSYFAIPLLILWLDLKNLDASGLENGRLISEPYLLIRYLVLPQLKMPLLT